VVVSILGGVSLFFGFGFPYSSDFSFYRQLATFQSPEDPLGLLPLSSQMPENSTHPALFSLPALISPPTIDGKGFLFFFFSFAAS